MTARNSCSFNIVCVTAAGDGVSGSVLLEAGGSQVSGVLAGPHPPVHVNGKRQPLLLHQQRHVCNCFCRCNSMSQRVSPGWLLSTNAVLAASSRLSAPPGYRPSWHVTFQPSGLHAPMTGLSAAWAYLCPSLSPYLGMSSDACKDVRACERPVSESSQPPCRDWLG